MLNTRITFIRHGHAVDGKVDKTRPLSAKGRLQAKQRALQLTKRSLFDLIITSSAVRAKETAEIIADTIETAALVTEIDELYQPPNLDDRKIVNELLETLGGVPLEVYNNCDIKGAWHRYSLAAFHRVFSAIECQSSSNVLVVAHGNIINSLGLQFSKNVSSLNEVYFNNCEGFEIYNDRCIFLP